VLLCAGLPAPADDADVSVLEGEARALAQALQQRLQAQLLSAVSIGGLAEALDVCQIRAPAVARELSVNGWTLRRTALKVRNPANRPSEWERHQLENMSAAVAAGADPGGLAVAQVRDAPGGPRFYYMQPIVTGQVCLACHGAELSVEVEQALTRMYPNDQATDFGLGTLRGAFTFNKVLDGR